MNGWTFRAVWPIEDLDLRARTAIDRAAAELAEVAERASARLLSSPEWTVEEVADPIEWPYTECVVAACAPAVPARPTREQWPTILAHLVAHRWPDQRIAALLQVPVASLTRLHRHASSSAGPRRAA